MKKSKADAQDLWNRKCGAVMRKAARVCGGKGQFWNGEEIAILAALAVELKDVSLRLQKTLDPILDVDLDRFHYIRETALFKVVAKCQKRYYKAEKRYDGQHRGA